MQESADLRPPSSHAAETNMAEVLQAQKLEVQALIDRFIDEQSFQIEEQRRYLKNLTDAQVVRFEAILSSELSGRPVRKYPTLETNQPKIGDIDCELRESNSASHLDSELKRNNMRNDTCDSMLVHSPSEHSDDGQAGRQSCHQANVELFDTLLAQASGSLSHNFAATFGGQYYLDRCSDFLLKKRLPQALRTTACSLIDGFMWHSVMTSMIVLNALFIAVSVNDFLKRTVAAYFGTELLSAAPLWIKVIDIFFAMGFAVELVVRVVAEEFGFLFGNPEAAWNILDMLVVFSAWIEVSMTLASADGQGDLSLLRIFRVLRVLRSLRIVRIFRTFRELRLILLSLLGSLLPLMWATLCLLVLIFIFGVLLLQAIAGFIMEASDEDEEIVSGLIAQFDSFPKTLVTLFMAISGGSDWIVVYQSLESISYAYGMLFIMYIIIMVFGVLNVITGIFVEGSIAKARADKELAIAEEIGRNELLMKHLMALFADLDKDKSNTITLDEWLEFCNKKEAKAALSLIGLDVNKTYDIFRLIDLDGSAELELHEFVVGAMQLGGSAKMVDVETLLRNNKKLMDKCTERFDRIEQRIEAHIGENTASLSRLEIAIKDLAREHL